MQDVQLAALGPVSFAESPLASRVRFHQAWYRAAVLGIESYGSSVHGRVSTPRGSILPAAAALAGKNFTSDHAHQLYRERRSRGWGLDPTRCTAYLTSSQALTLNIFGPLLNDKAWFACVLTDVLGTPVREVLQAHIEHAPHRPSQALGDRTMLDVWVIAKTENGQNLSIAIEVKYSDRFSSRVLPIWANPKYREIANSQHPPLWNLDAPASRTRAVNQLIRCHALCVFLAQEARATRSQLIVVHHPADSAAAAVIDEFDAIVDNGTLHPCGLDSFLLAMSRSANATQSRTVDELRTRYVAYHLSDALWERRGEATNGL
ncbi:PGN_0703 family putative restriction endonuclease [Williamsia sp. MIQD14]|uniref:PGN_0703 family putative restriction endonuclease n=1 Tax=Williamsia sp. MIQD14 TaxID=3425703 RepID=UPI003DA0503A